MAEVLLQHDLVVDQDKLDVIGYDTSQCLSVFGLLNGLDIQLLCLLDYLAHVLLVVLGLEGVLAPSRGVFVALRYAFFEYASNVLGAC